MDRLGGGGGGGYWESSTSDDDDLEEIQEEVKEDENKELKLEKKINEFLWNKNKISWLAFLWRNLTGKDIPTLKEVSTGIVQIANKFGSN